MISSPCMRVWLLMPVFKCGALLSATITQHGVNVFAAASHLPGATKSMANHDECLLDHGDSGFMSSEDVQEDISSPSQASGRPASQDVPEDLPPARPLVDENWEQIHSFLSQPADFSKEDQERTVANVAKYLAKLKADTLAEVLEDAAAKNASRPPSDRRAEADQLLGTAIRNTVRNFLLRKTRLGPENFAGTTTSDGLAGANKNMFMHSLTQKQYLKDWYKKVFPKRKDTSQDDMCGWYEEYSWTPNLISRDEREHRPLASGLYRCSGESLESIKKITIRKGNRFDSMQQWLSVDSLTTPWFEATSTSEGVATTSSGGGTDSGSTSSNSARAFTSSASGSGGRNYNERAGTMYPNNLFGHKEFPYAGETTAPVAAVAFGFESGDIGSHAPWHEQGPEARARFVEHVVQNDNPSSYYPRVFLERKLTSESAQDFFSAPLAPNEDRLRFQYKSGGEWDFDPAGYTTDFDPSGVFFADKFRTRGPWDAMWPRSVWKFLILESPTVFTMLHCETSRNWDCRFRICERVNEAVYLAEPLS
ncbi:unnamed protein product [Amoebophrya sp. A120]|nr:unnamed protein product [Amoebophrya sp. A120]|eukprot:GSA120T00008248001.1